MSAAQLQLVHEQVSNYSNYLKNYKVEPDESITEILSSNTELSIKLDNCIEYIERTYPSLNNNNYRSQCINRLYILLKNIKTEIIQKSLKVPETVKDIILSKYSTFVDHAPCCININDCEPIIEYDFPESNLSIERAKSIQHLHISKRLYPKLVSYLSDDYEYDSTNILPNDVYIRIMQEKTLLEFETSCNIRYIKEMTIEYNQIEKRDELIKLYSDGKTLDYIIELLKGKYYSSWGNDKDYEWIAKDLPDYDEEYKLLELYYKS